jgi:hypothetical protein
MRMPPTYPAAQRPVGLPRTLAVAPEAPKPAAESMPAAHPAVDASDAARDSAPKGSTLNLAAPSDAGSSDDAQPRGDADRTNPRGVHS